jgi:hypothetical protein
MTLLTRTLGRKATKATVRHSVRGLSAKARRKPLRSAGLLSLGGVLGGAAGWFAGRRTQQAS